MLLYGIRFDVSVIILTNSLFILLYLLPFKFIYNNAYRLLVRGLFVIVNSIALFSNCVDFTFFSFTVKRTNASVFNFFGGQIGNDLAQLLPTLFKEYWYIILIGGVFTYLIIYVYNKTEKENYLDQANYSYKSQSAVFILALGLSLLLYRGGFQLKPISMVTAGEYASVKHIPLVLNTPFTILKTLDVKAIEPSTTWRITDEEKLIKAYNPIHHANGESFKKLNIIIIALESFSKEYVGALNNRNKGSTPFLDSLINESLTFTDGYSNGKTSIDGIPSIVASIPTWMNEPFITSPYGTNPINALPNLLKQQGYYSAFFHGGTNGTMGFDAFANIAGYDDYYGRSEYNNDNDFDGNWGIWDEEFLQYSADVINTKQQPFFATLFTLSSHHPYPIPDKYKDTFKKGELPIEESINYSDFALRQFFNKVKNMPWFDNTLFVLCADHTSVSKDPFYTNKVGNYSIPILYYHPKENLKGLNSTITQQIDIAPSILDYINYPNSYFSFGNSVFDTTAQHFALTHNSNMYQFMEKDHILLFDGEKVKGLYNYKKDSLLKSDLRQLDTVLRDDMEFKTKAIIQTYQQRLINNKMH